uniref:Uncharacterized protein n=1 Tax=Rhizophora mucronata TaxID=61149 RepID=A0A2P2NTM7_RHIMU
MLHAVSKHWNDYVLVE